MKIKKNHLLMIIFLLILFIYIIGNRSNFTKTRTIERIKGMNTQSPIEDFHITNKSVFLWGNNTLYLCDKEGNILKKIERDDDKLQNYFINNYAFLYEEDLKRVYQYSEYGELLNTIVVPGKILNISYENSNTVFHIEDKDKEILYVLGNDNSLSELYSTGNRILAHNLIDKNNFAVGEMQISANGYKSLLNLSKKGVNEQKTLNNEVVMFIKAEGNSFLALTNENLYRYIDKENFYTAKIPNITDIAVNGKITYLLHSGILSKYNYKLEETEKKIIAANVNKIKLISGSVYVLGPSDIGGEIGKGGEFYRRLGYSIEKIEIEGLTIGLLKDNELNLYRITNKRISEGENEDISIK
ncbi:hypothetical protein [Peptoniphilus raoultii]|uniref:hypothetical protein n=1 Tax=Peptoniphilus raoultii TaxID=1776387 RepID=UPI0008DAE442|nr:hypothetical protein [Peptoniphilus raoultii]